MMPLDQARAILGNEEIDDRALMNLLRSMYGLAELELAVFNQSNQQTHAT